MSASWVVGSGEGGLVGPVPGVHPATASNSTAIVAVIDNAVFMALPFRTVRPGTRPSLARISVHTVPVGPEIDGIGLAVGRGDEAAVVELLGHRLQPGLLRLGRRLAVL